MPQHGLPARDHSPPQQLHFWCTYCDKWYIFRQAHVHFYGRHSQAVPTDIKLQYLDYMSSTYLYSDDSEDEDHSGTVVDPTLERHQIPNHHNSLDSHHSVSITRTTELPSMCRGDGEEIMGLITGQRDGVNDANEANNRDNVLQRDKRREMDDVDQDEHNNGTEGSLTDDTYETNNDIDSEYFEDEDEMDHDSDTGSRHKQEACERYMWEVQQAIIKTKGLIQDAKALVWRGKKSLPTNSRTKTRMSEEHEVFSHDLDRVAAGHAMTVSSYWRWGDTTRSTDSPQESEFRYSYVHCDEEEAHQIMVLGAPSIPIVTRKSVLDRYTPTVEQFLLYLRCKASVEVHDYSRKPRDKSNSHKLPVAWTPTQVEGAINECPPRVINCLNLAGFKENSLPPCFQGLPDFNILEKIRESDTSGKSVERVPNDLSGMVEFTLLATTHATSLAHQDSQGTITTLEVLEGEKLCLIWPSLDREAKIEWQTDAQDRYSPEASPLALYLRPGDTLIMPAGTVHAVYTMSTCLVSGRRFWEARKMVSVIEAMLLERQYPDLTNEDVAMESAQKLRGIERAWSSTINEVRHYWTFGFQAELDLFRARLEEWRGGKMSV